jgi:hypothetical protein
MEVREFILDERKHLGSSMRFGTKDVVIVEEVDERRKKEKNASACEIKDRVTKIFGECVRHSTSWLMRNGDQNHSGKIARAANKEKF